MILASSRHFAGEPTILASILTNPGKLPIIEAVLQLVAGGELQGSAPRDGTEWSPARLPDDRIRLRKTRFCVCPGRELEPHLSRCMLE
jgi:hypothetical protein